MNKTVITIYNLQNKSAPPVKVSVKRTFGELSVLRAVVKVANAINATYSRAGVMLYVDKSSQLAYDVSYVTEDGLPILGMMIEEDDEYGDPEFNLNPS